MSDESKNAAREHAARAAKQMKHAATNAAEATEAAAETVKDEVVDTSEESYNRFKDLISTVVTNEMSRGVVFLSVGIIFSAIGARTILNARGIANDFADLQAG